MPTAPSAGWDVPTILAAITLLVLVAIVHLLLRRWVRRRSGEASVSDAAWPDSSSARRWLVRGTSEVLSPLALLIWIHGLSSAGVLLFGRMTPPSLADQALAGLRWAYGLSVLFGGFWLLSRLGRIIEAFLRSFATRAETSWDDIVLPMAGKAIRWTLPLLVLILGTPALSMSPALAQVVGNGTSLQLIGVVAFILFQMVDAAAAFVLKPHSLDVSDNLRARAIQTQVIVLKEVAVTAISVFTLASMLMVFDSVRQFGASILASAGIAGMVVWDQRALVVPITHFIEQPFQDWTRSTADIIGSVFLHVDYTVPVDALRLELTRILGASPHWDGRVNALQVTDAKEHTLELRALASAANASLAWDLRCEVREKLVAFVQQNYPNSLPRLRGSLTAGPGTPVLVARQSDEVFT